MNIIIANDQEFNPQVGGVERVSSTLAKSFISLNHNVYFIACIRSPYSQDYIPATEQFFLPDGSNIVSDENIKYFSNFVIEKKIDIIMNQAGDILNFGLLCYEVVKRTKVKLVSVIHFDPLSRINQLDDFSNSILKVKSFSRRVLKRIIYPYRYYKIQKIERHLYQKIYSLSDKVVLLSPFFIQPFNKLIRNEHSDKIDAILNPCPDMSISANIARKKQILYVGRVNYFQKRTDRIIEIWEKINQDIPEWELVIVGDGPLLNDLKKYVKDKNIARVNFKGNCDPAIHYQESEILCMTSNFEGLSMVLIEAAKLGCIPMAFDSFASVHDIIEDHLNGIIVKKYDMNIYTKALLELVLNKKLREELRRGTLLVHKKFDQDTITNQWINLFGKVIVNENHYSFAK